jgi:hypothetical protein
MIKNYLPFVLLIITVLLQNCEDRELVNKQLYNLQNVIIEEKLNLKDEQYTLSLNFTAQKTASDYKIELAYPELIQSEQKSFLDFGSIVASLYGFSLELYDIASGNLVHSYIITADNTPKMERQTASLSLGDNLSLLKDRNYELRLTLPGKIIKEDNLVEPVLVMGTPPKI